MVGILHTLSLNSLSGKFLISISLEFFLGSLESYSVFFFFFFNFLSLPGLKKWLCVEARLCVLGVLKATWSQACTCGDQGIGLQIAVSKRRPVRAQMWASLSVFRA